MKFFVPRSVNFYEVLKLFWLSTEQFVAICSKRGRIVPDLYSWRQQSHICNKIRSYFLPVLSVLAAVTTKGDIANPFALSGSHVSSNCVGVMFCKWFRINSEKV